ncbi:PBP1A family penicillin-binding protein [Bacillus sp. RG28]|uniref:PBP1A family penicillin-binding protein n=2 Tax=Gottfriedia endophytica TaxID=2820819 RepID=A0A940NNR7_9BACI|nr:PBP1A family penicillin-binding protein [Gottfriedia endophytica]
MEKPNNNNHKPKSSSPKKREGLWKRITLTILTIAVVCILAGIGTFYYLVSDAPKLDPKKLQDPLSSKILDKDGNVIAEVGTEQRTKVTYNQIPKVVENAFIDTEDVRFYQHKGVDVRRIFGAILANVTGGFGSEGGSTITQQVVKNSLLSSKKTIRRKVQEWYLAFQLEQKYSKQQILEMYLNKVYFSNGAGGPGVYGIAKACQTYFNKDLKDITLPEAAMLAGMVQSPNNYNPATHPQAAENRRNIVLGQMLKYGSITQEQFDKAKAIPMKSLVHVQPQESQPYQAFIDEVVKEVKQETGADIYTEGLTVQTTLDPKAQKEADDITNRGNGFYPNDDFQAGFTLTDTKTGEIRAIGAGRNAAKGGFNYATDIQRQPGSSIKPILDYGPAIQYLKWSTFHQIDDSSNFHYSDGTPVNNWDKKGYGQMSIRYALEQSRNIPAIETLQQVGLENARGFADGLGIHLNHIYESYAIGGFDGVSPLQMAGAYAAFGNGGVYIKPHAVTKVTFQDGTEQDLTPKPKQAMSDYTAYMITDMLRGVVKSGTGTKARVPGLDMAGKTGTTNYDQATLAKFGFPSNATHDSWFVGYTPDVTVSVWTGYPINKTGEYLGKNSSNIAKYIARDMLAATADYNSRFKQPSSVYENNGELYIKGEKVDNVPTPKTIKAPSQVTTSFNPVTSNIDLTWNYPADLLPSTTFEVAYDVNGQKATPLSIKDTQASIPSIMPGDKVNISITAITADGRSSTVKVSVNLSNNVNPNPNGNNGNPNPNGNNGNPNTGNPNNGNPNTGDPSTGKPNTGNPNDGNPNGNPNNGNNSGGKNGNPNNNGNPSTNPPSQPVKPGNSGTTGLKNQTSYIKPNSQNRLNNSNSNNKIVA